MEKGRENILHKKRFGTEGESERKRAKAAPLQRMVFKVATDPTKNWFWKGGKSAAI